jgi:hypothetical protein
LLNWNKGFNTGCFTKDDAGLGGGGVQEFSQAVMNLKKLGARVFWWLQPWSLVSWSGAIWAFGIMLPLDIKFGRQSLSAN